MNVHVGDLSSGISEANYRRKYQTGTTEGMRITIEDLGPSMLQRLHDRLEEAGRLRCSEHGRGVVAVTLHGRENGWFDTRWTTCCEGLERQAVAIVKQRC